MLLIWIKATPKKNSMSEKDPATSCIILMLKRFKLEFIIRGYREGVLSWKGRDFVAASVPYDHVLPWKVGYNLLKAKFTKEVSKCGVLYGVFGDEIYRVAYIIRD